MSRGKFRVQSNFCRMKWGLSYEQNANLREFPLFLTIVDHKGKSLKKSFRSYLGPLKPYRNGFVLKIYL